MSAIVPTGEAEAALRARLAALAISDLALLVKVAAEAIDDIAACREIADVVGHSYEVLSEWGERVLYSAPADGQDTLALVSELAMGWYENLPLNEDALYTAAPSLRLV